MNADQPPAEQPQYFYFGGGYSGSGTPITGIAVANGVATPIPGSPFTVTQASNGYQIAAAGDLIFTFDTTGTLLSWRVDPQSGTLTQIRASNPILGNLSIDPSYQFIYGFPSNVPNNNIYGYSINHQTGGLTPLQGSPFVYSVPMEGPGAFSLGGAWMCVGTFDGPGAPATPFCSERDPKTGALLTGLNDQVFSTGIDVLLLGPFLSSDYLLATGSFAGAGIFQLSSSGIQQMASYPELTGTTVADQSGTLVASDNGTTITLFSFDPTSLSLTQDAQVTPSWSPAGLRFSCDGKYLAVFHFPLVNYVSIFAVSSNSLTEITGSPIALPNGSWSAVTSCSPPK